MTIAEIVKYSKSPEFKPNKLKQMLEQYGLAVHEAACKRISEEVVGSRNKFPSDWAKQREVEKISRSFNIRLKSKMEVDQHVKFNDPTSKVLRRAGRISPLPRI